MSQVVFQDGKRKKRLFFPFFPARKKFFTLFMKKKLELSSFRCIVLMLWFAPADPGTKTTDRAAGRIRSCRKTARPFEADDCGTANNAVHAIGRSGACGVVLHLYAGNEARDTARNKQEPADGGSRPRHHDTTNESDTWRQTE